MKVLLDQGTPAPLRKHLADHQVAIATELGWGTLANGELLAEAEARGFQVFITTDQNLKHQQSLSRRKVAILVLSTTSWPRIEKAARVARGALASISAGAYVELSIP